MRDTTCLKCKAEIPEQSTFCCVCGKKQLPSPHKKRKRPNGTGAVVYLGEKRKKPYAVRVTANISPDGFQKFRYIAYCATKTEAELELSKYHVCPTSQLAELTLSQVHTKWKNSYYKFISQQTRDNYNAAWNYISELEKRKFRELRTDDFQRCVDNSGKGKSTQQKIKILCTLLSKYALENDVSNKNYATFIRLQKFDKVEKEVFSDAQISRIEAAAGTVPHADEILIMIYTGLRINEFLSLTADNIKLKEGVIVGGLKTDAGKNRIVPLHPKIKKYVAALLNRGGKTLICKNDGTRFKVNNYRENVYKPTLTTLGIPYIVPHCTRHTFASLLDRCKAPGVDIQRLLGHTDYSFTSNTYIHKDVEDLKRAVALIP